jgi:hypothetical protein
MSIPDPRRRGESPSVAAAIRVYSDLPDGGLQIIDVPMGAITAPFVEQARAAGGVNIRIVVLDRDGSVIDRVRVRV